MKFKPSVHFCLQDIVVGVIWYRTEDVLPTGAPEYKLPIYQVLHVGIIPLPCCSLHLRFMWGASV